MAYPVTLNGRTYTLADFEGTNYVDGLPDAFEDFVTHAGNTYQTTSTTSIALGTGTKVFTVADSGKPYASGTPLRISNQADATDYIDALVTTYTGTTLTVNAIGYSGTGTIAAWNINIGGGPITVAGTLPINQGGTGATTAAAAATALGLGTGDTPTFAGLNVTGTANFGDVNITNVGDIALDTISSDAGTSVTVSLGSDAGDDFIVGSNYLVVEGDTGNVNISGSSGATLKLTSTDTTGADTELLGQIDFVSSDVSGGSAGTQARIKGVYEDNGDSSGLAFLTGASTGSGSPTLNEVMRIRHEGNVGIGTASPSSTYRASIYGDGSSIIGGIEFRNAAAGGSTFTIGHASTASPSATLNVVDSANLLFNTANTERMRIDSSGRLLIGATVHSISSSQKFEVQGGIAAFQLNDNSASPVIIKNNNSVAGGGVPYIVLQDSGGNRGAIYRNSSNEIGLHGQGALTFHTGSSAPTTERMRIDSSGNVGIGGTTASPSGFVRLLNLEGSDVALQLRQTTTNTSWEIGNDNTGLFRILNNGLDRFAINSSSNVLFGCLNFPSASVQGFAISGSSSGQASSSGSSTAAYNHLLFYNGNGLIGYIATSGSTTTYANISDYRLKTDVTYDWDATTRLKQLKPARFAWIADGDDAVPVDGFLAHEVQDIVPEAIVGEKDGMRDEEYQVSAATGDIYTPATDDADEVIHSADVERPEELAEGQQWRETTAAVMGTRSVPDYQGIDQSKLTPLLTKALIEAVEKIEQLEARITALEAN